MCSQYVPTLAQSCILSLQVRCRCSGAASGCCWNGMLAGSLQTCFGFDSAYDHNPSSYTHVSIDWNCSYEASESPSSDSLVHALSQLAILSLSAANSSADVSGNATPFKKIFFFWFEHNKRKPNSSSRCNHSPCQHAVCQHGNGKRHKAHGTWDRYF